MRPWEVLSVTWADNTAKVLSLQDKSRALATALVVLLFFKKKVHFFSSCLFFFYRLHFVMFACREKV